MIQKHMITIDSVQLSPEGNSRQSFSTVGRYSLKKGVGRISYEDTQLTGHEGCVTRLLVDGSRSVMLQRTGDVLGSLIIKPGERHVCHYDMGFGTMSLAVGEAHIENNLSEQGGSVKFRYSLDLDSNVFAKNEVTISVREISNAGQTTL